MTHADYPVASSIADDLGYIACQSTVCSLRIRLDDNSGMSLCVQHKIYPDLCSLARTCRYPASLEDSCSSSFYLVSDYNTNLHSHHTGAHFLKADQLAVVIKFIKAKFFSEPSPETSPDTTPSSAPPPTASLDLITVRTSLTMEMTGLTLLSLNFGPTAFVLITLWITLGSGTTPALNSLALGLLPDKSSSGKLFGALSVLHAIGSTLLSPILFGEIFAATVGIYAPTIFAVGAFLPASALLVLSFVRLGRAPELTGESAIEGVGQTRPTSPRKLRSASPRG